MRSSNQRQDISFAVSQRPRPGTRLSSFLHGESTFHRRKSSKGLRSFPCASVQNVPTARHELEHYPPRDETFHPGLRSPSSTRSIIDPLHSPLNVSTPMADNDIADVPDDSAEYVHPAFASPPFPERQRVPQDWRSNRHRRARPKHASEAAHRRRFPHNADPHTRRKLIGCLVSGTLLTVVMTTCRYLSRDPQCAS